MTISLQAYTGISRYQTIRVTGNVDIVLGVEWLSTLGRIIFDFSSRTIEFRYQGKKHVLRGATNKLKTTKSKTLIKKCAVENQLYMLSLMPTDYAKDLCYNIQMDQGNETPLILTSLLDEFASIFEMPTTLPPHRGPFDHRISLFDSENPVSKRPYRYPGIKKDIIEKLVQKMLDQGMIQHSTSPYASPVVLVGKKDGKWRLCVDYRELNQITIKDKFLIPIIDNLLDELGGAQVFLKIDLRAGYHQLRMFEGDTHKITFKTHEVHYEFLVMPFGLTIALSSFQSLMNLVFEPLLRKSVLPTSTNLKQLRGFLGLASYYKRFTKGFGAICRPLHDLLKKDRFSWSVQATEAFDQLKKALITTPVLAMPDYTKTFLVENDASRKGIELRWKGRLVIGKDLQLRKNIITLWHATPQGWHSGMDATTKRLQALFYWKSLNSDVRDFINKCDTYQRNKYDASAYPGLLQPLPTDGQIEVLNRTLETYLRCFCSDKSKEWVYYLPLTEWWYNTTYHTTLKCTPYEVLYGQKPLIHLPYLAGESSSDMVDRLLITRETVIRLLKFHILRAQQRIKDLTDKHRSDRSFKLKKCHEVPCSISHSPVIQLSSPYCPTPERVLDKRLVKKDGTFSNPLAHGSGHVNPQKALSPRLVYNVRIRDHIKFLCSLNYSMDEIQSIVKRLNFTGANKFADAGQINYVPSFSVLFGINTKRVFHYTREVTNVGAAGSVYEVPIDAPSSVTVIVKP
ncbi:hypothetical protein FXO38_11049 [Capsicum annuum]|nr:hypothetical protein FXO38_11049 [Capsicum annuum]